MGGLVSGISDKYSCRWSRTAIVSIRVSLHMESFIAHILSFIAADAKKLIFWGVASYAKTNRKTNSSGKRVIFDMKGNIYHYRGGCHIMPQNSVRTY